jgi:antitoxin HigA-1
MLIWRIIMADTKLLRNADRAPTHPGEILREDVLPALGLPVMTAAKALGVSRQTLHRILSGASAITPEMALRIGKLCGNGPHLWLKMQAAHDLWHAARAIGGELAAIETRAA